MPPRRRSRRGPLDRPPPEPRPEKVIAGRAWIRGRLQPIEIGVDADGRIARIAKSIRGGEREELGDRVLIPAATDVHVHLREPAGGGPLVETFASGTEAAALGGVGAVGDMPNTEPPVDRPSRVQEKADRARGRLAVDVVVYAALRATSPVEALARAAGAFKLYLSPTTGLDTPPDPVDVAALLTRVAATGMAVTVHAEDPRLFRTVASLPGPIAWNAHRPVAAERGAVESLLPAPVGLRLHVAHVSSPEVAFPLQQAGHSCEATPQHLLLHAAPDGGSRDKVNPPLRSAATQRALWEEFRTGKIPILASDHAPHPISAKDQEFAHAPSGMPGVETMLPLLLEKVRSGDLDLPVLQAAACDRPARWFGLSQGRLAVGERANLVAVDFRQRRTVHASRLHTVCGWSAFEGWPAVFPDRHYRDGMILVDGGEFVGGRTGAILRPDYAPRAAP
jgi:dihydroorotase